MAERRDGSDDAGRPPGAATGSGPTAEQLRADIDSGRTRDKVAHSDPAAAPLGTDDEAAGTPPTAEQVAAARGHETARGGLDPTARPGLDPVARPGLDPAERPELDPAPSNRAPIATGLGGPLLWGLVAVAVLIAIVALIL